MAPDPSSESTNEAIDSIAERLIAWFRAHKRDLPWRGASPYAVWVSEIMLQQTQVATVIPYYLRFLDRFPTVTALAEAPLEEVLRYWSGLGYYARARNLHRAAQVVAESFEGRVPGTQAEISTLPGIGRYTAGAILSIAYGVQVPLVDGNVARVLSRVFEVRGDIKSTEAQARLWFLAEQLVPAEAPGDFNQGLMELGALICIPSDPRCEQCPLLPFCFAGNSPDPSALPEIAPGRATVTVTHVSAVIFDDAGRVLIIQRPPHGLWGGLWEFPRIVCEPAEPPEEAARRAAREAVGAEITPGKRLHTVRHTVTHHRITLHAFEAQIEQSSPDPHPRACASLQWVSPDSLPDFPFSAPQTLLVEAVLRRIEHKSADIQHTLDLGSN